MTPKSIRVRKKILKANILCGFRIRNQDGRLVIAGRSGDDPKAIM